MKKNYAEDCLTFIGQGVSPYHVVAEAEKRLLKNGFVELKESENWKIEAGGSYFVKRNDSALIAFRIPRITAKAESGGAAKMGKGFYMVAAHSDSPTFKIKTNPEILVEDKYLKLNTEGYGRMLRMTWFDRPLSIAGRLVMSGRDGLYSRNVNLDEDLLVIPSLAIHMSRDADKGTEYKLQTDLLPLAGGSTGSGKLSQKLAQAAGVSSAEEILGSDLFLYVREQGRLAGMERELMLAPRLDDLECVYGALEALLQIKPLKYVSMCVILNNEEVGSLTLQGAASTFLKNTLERIGESLGVTGSDYLKCLSESFLISADNAHAMHPNHPEKSDYTNRPVLNGGIVLKHHGGQKYTTDAYSEAMVRQLCRKAKVCCQDYHNHSDIAGGATLGNLAVGQVAVPAADIGLAQLAMHSAVETAGSRDVEDLIKVLKEFYKQ